MRYKFSKIPLFERMEEWKQSNEQQQKYLRYVMSVRMSKKHFELFDLIAKSYNLYHLLINSAAFELLRLNFQEYIIILQKTTFEIIVEIRCKQHGN